MPGGVTATISLRGSGEQNLLRERTHQDAAPAVLATIAAIDS
jgi:hypothetical protein